MVHLYQVALSAREHVDKERNHEGFLEKALPIDFEIEITSKTNMRILLIARNMMKKGIQVIVVYIGFCCVRRTLINAAK